MSVSASAKINFDYVVTPEDSPIFKIPQELLPWVFKYFTNDELQITRLVCRKFFILSSEFIKKDPRILHKRKFSAVEYAAELLFDRATQRRLHDAVVIIPCGCRVNHEAVAKIHVVAGKHFQETVKEEFCPSPSCLQPMIGWNRDRKTQEAAKVFHDLVGLEGRIYTRLPKEKKVKLDPTQFPYPGERGNFVIEENFVAFEGARFFNSTNQSFVEFINFTHSQRECSLFLRFKKSDSADHSKFIKCISANGIDVSDHDRVSDGFKSVIPEQMKKLFELIIANNDFPQEEAVRILNHIGETNQVREAVYEV